MTVNPESGAYHFSFGIDHEPADLEATLERLLELPAELAADGDRRVALIFDEFQEVETIDPGLPRLMRTVFEQQPEVARVYLGSRRHMMERLFNDRNEPFWRSAKKVELGPIEPERFAGFIGERFRALAQGRRAPRSSPSCSSAPAATRTRPRSSATSSGSRRRSTAPPGSTTSTRPSPRCCARRTPTSRSAGRRPSAAQKLVLAALAQGARAAAHRRLPRPPRAARRRARCRRRSTCSASAS